MEQPLLSEIHSSSSSKNEEEFGVDVATLCAMVQGGNTQLLQSNGGVAGIASKLLIDEQQGIQSHLPQELLRRRRIFGSNTIPEPPLKNILTFIAAASKDLTLILLTLCAIVSILVGTATKGWRSCWIDGAGIIISVLLVISVTAASDFQQYLQFRSLDEEKGKIRAQVSRSGKRAKIFVSEIVVGEIVHLGLGDRVPADGLLLCGQSLVVDESSMTGESENRAKSVDRDPFLISGTKIRDGSGVMIVTGVGMNTEWGHAMSILKKSSCCSSSSVAAAPFDQADSSDGTPLQQKLENLATLIGKIGMIFAAMTFAVLAGKFLIGRSKKGDLHHWSGSDAMILLQFFATAVTIIVVAVPEGLPLAVTLSLAFAMKKMMKEKALVRHLSACETMGSATCICSDKTGTLTTNQMAVVNSWIGDSCCSSHDLGRRRISEILLEGVFLNTSGEVAVCPNGACEVMGSPTEAALLQFGVDLAGGFAAAKMKQRSRVIRVEPFNSIKKRMGVVVSSSSSSSEEQQEDSQDEQEQNDRSSRQEQRLRRRIRAHWKGAAEIVLGMCDSYLDSQGIQRRLDDAKIWELRGIIRDLADEGLRTICLAFKDLEEEEEEEEEEEDHHHHLQAIPEKGFVCLAIVGIKDPVRPGVKQAVRLCSSAGIRVRMVTGDNLYTAMAIARECGILREGGEAVEGPEFRSWSQEEMRRRIPRLQVLARTSPSDKHRLVKELQAMGEVVAVTGDGTNDAPALFEADIGISMGISGTEVAKESSDIIILDDNFASIVNVAKWGRSVYTNIQKFVQFQATVNLVALILNFWSACFKGAVPLTVVQLLWVNLIMDTFGALALATEPPHSRLMKRPPVGRKEHFISPIMLRNVIAQAAYQLIVLILLQFKGNQIFHQDDDHHLLLNTIIFNSFVFLQVFNEFNSREMERINIFHHLNNWIFIAIVSTTVIFQVLLVQFLGGIASTTPLNGNQWLFCIGVGSISLLIDTLVKFLDHSLRKCFKSSKGRIICSSVLHAASYPLIPKVDMKDAASTIFKAKSYTVIPRGPQQV